MQPEDRKPLAYCAVSIVVGVAIAVVQMRYPAFLPETLDWAIVGCGIAFFACIVWLLYEHLDKNQRHWWREKRITSLIGMIICGLGFLGFFAAYLWPDTQVTLNASHATPAPPPHLAPVHQEPTSSAEVPPFVSESESIARATLISKMRDKYPDRIIADVTPDYLLDLYKNRMTILGDRDTEPFIGKWFILSGTIADVSAVGPSAKIGIYIQFKLADPFRHVLMFFDNTWNDRLSVLLSGQEFLAFCRLDRILGSQIRFDPCEPIYLGRMEESLPRLLFTNPPDATPPSPAPPVSPEGKSR
jgi:hypothetical protein